MRNILLIGIGQTGSNIAELFLNKFNNSDVIGRALAIDTDEKMLSEISVENKIHLTDDRSLETIVEKLGDGVKNYFPGDWENDGSIFAQRLDMCNGSNLWRMKALLAFDYYLSEEKNAVKLHGVLDELVAECGEDGEIELYTAASLAGGTGSGLLLPIVLYVKDYIKNKGGRIARSDAFLAMPDIYKNVLTAERRTKAYANAYAALRELNAVNKIAFSGDLTEKVSAHPPIDFKIVLSSGEGKSLFDTNDERCYASDAAPFNKVALFERIPTVDSVAEHVSVIADAMIFACNNGEENLSEKKSVTEIGCSSITKVNYPIDCIVDYILKKQLHALVTGEFGTVERIVQKNLFSKRMNAKNERRRVSESVETYRDSYIQTIEGILENAGGLPETLIGRTIDTNIKLDTPADLYDNTWVLKLDERIERTVYNDSFEYVRKVIDDNLVRSKASKKRSSGSEKRTETSAIAADVKPKLSDAFLRAQTALSEGESDFKNGIMSTVYGDEFTFANDILSENGKYLHPIYGLFRLCLAHKRLEEYKNKYSDVPDVKKENYPFPVNIMRVGCYRENEKDKLPRSRYFRYGEDRFIDLMGFDYGENKEENIEDQAENKKKKKKEKKKKVAPKKVITDDRETFFKDLEAVYNRLLLGVKHYRYVETIEMLEGLIDRYSSFLSGLLSITDDIEADVSLALVNGSSGNATTVNVGASADEKINLCAEYLEIYSNNIDAMLANDAKISEIVANLVFSDLTRPTIERKRIRSMIAEAEQVYREHLVSTEFYKNTLDRSIMTAMQDSVDGRFSEDCMSYSQIFASRYNPLKTPIDVKGMCDEIVTTSEVILSESVALAIENDQNNDKEPGEYVNDIVSEYTEYGTKVRFIKNLSDKELYLCKKREGYSMDAVEFLNELSSDAVGYSAYRQSLREMADKQSPMWNSSLIYTRGVARLLPFISPKMQDEYELIVAKAVLHTLLNGSLFVCADDNGDKVYHVNTWADKQPLNIGGDTVKKGDLRGVMLWAFDNYEWSESMAEEYDKSNYKYGNDALTDLTFELLMMLDGDKTLDAEGYAKGIASVVNETILCRYTDKDGRFSERSGVDYASDLKARMEKIRERLGEDKTAELLKWLNSKGTFLDCTINGGFCEFEF